jgi:NAD(P)-dependent dehydrogenase (short-subunit alcohol dehydrogenase family)
MELDAIVTGGASGLGAATARELAGRGARVVVADISDDKGNAVADSIGGVFAHVDVTSTDDIIAAAELAKTLGPVRALVNCAGTGWAARTVGRGGYETAHDLAAFRRILEINTIGTPIYGEGPASEAFKEKLKRDVLFPSVSASPKSSRRSLSRCSRTAI